MIFKKSSQQALSALFTVSHVSVVSQAQAQRLHPLGQAARHPLRPLPPSSIPRPVGRPCHHSIANSSKGVSSRRKCTGTSRLACRGLLVLGNQGPCLQVPYHCNMAYHMSGLKAHIHSCNIIMGSLHVCHSTSICMTTGGKNVACMRDFQALRNADRLQYIAPSIFVIVLTAQERRQQQLMSFAQLTPGHAAAVT